MGKRMTAKLNPMYSTGIPGIDIQHNELISICNNTLDILEKTNPSFDSVAVFAEDILKCLKSHRSTEENLLKMVGFPKTAEHMAQHKILYYQLKEVMKALKNNDCTEISHYVFSFRNALLTHISVFDREYTDHIEEIITLKKKFNISALRAQVLAG